MKRVRHTITAAIAGLAAAFGAVAVGTPAAIAATPKHVTKAEFNQIHKGMTRRVVEAKFGAKTVKSITRESGVKQHRAYRTKGDGATSPVYGVWVSYKFANGKWQVTQWSAKWSSSWTNRNPADQRARVTPAQFNKVRNGMSMRDVHTLLGTSGDQYMIWTNGPNGNQTRMYRDNSKNPDGGYAVRYKKVNGTWQVAGKGASQSFMTG